MTVNNKLSEVLGTEFDKNVPVVKEKEQEILPVISTNDAAEDYRMARRTLQNLIRKGDMAIDDIHDLAKQTEKARDYEVMATLMRTVADSAKDLYDLQKKQKELNTDSRHGGISVDKAVFVGTPTEMLKRFKEQNK